jgi:hypothetical protein
MGGGFALDKLRLKPPIPDPTLSNFGTDSLWKFSTVFIWKKLVVSTRSGSSRLVKFNGDSSTIISLS